MYNKLELSNGIRVITENIPYVKSVSIGLWIEAGSRYEDINNNGVSHFIEHMLFKGTNKRSARDIADAIDSVGGQMNAFTSKECTCFYIKILDNHIDLAIDVLQDMLFDSKFEEAEIEKEKSVIIEEINMYEDSPEELVHDLLSKTLFNSHPLSYPILGNKKSVNNLTKKGIKEYFNTYYRPDNLVISVVGNINEKQLLKSLERNFGKWSNVKDTIQADISTPTIKGNFISRKKQTEQLHLCLGLQGINQGSDDLYSLLVLNNIFGGSMSSRLFQKVREDMGLAYSIYSYPSTYKDTGAFTIYAGLNPNHLINLSEIIATEIEEVKKNSFSDEEIYKSKEQLKGNYILGLESTSSRMSAYGQSELLNRDINTSKQIIDKINGVNKTSINELIKEIFDYNKMNIAYIGNLKDSDKTEKNLKNLYKNTPFKK
ncbi:insulinase family protein [Clostridium sp. D2Q-11]|uniref:Insulinase family protein n=1 Tax=Anaeromonas frigoriresistens TaxID=2683708 RepID=A0A942UZZ7_9FIRM|nr:insulinase family protein [Anaeromonas frigoriresistens]